MRKIYIFLIILFGVVLPFVTWSWAKLIGGRIVFSDFPHVVLIVFNLMAFLIMAIIAFLLLRKAAKMNKSDQNVRETAVFWGTLALIGFSINIHMSYWLTHSSTSPLLFIFYLPYALLSILAGCGVGWIFGRLDVNLRKRNLRFIVYLMNTLLLVLYVAINVYASNFGRFNLPAIPGVSMGETLFQKGSFFDAPHDLGAITSIELKQCDPEFKGDITVTGRGGAAFVSKEGELKAFVKFKEGAGFDVFPVDVENDGYCEFVDKEIFSVDLIDHNGGKLWAYGQKQSFIKGNIIDAGASPKDIVAFDANGAGKLYFLIPLLIPGKNEVHVLSDTGTLLKKLNLGLGEQIEGSKTADIDGDGRAELISFYFNPLSYYSFSLDLEYEIVIRDNRLQVVKRFTVKVSRFAEYNKSFSLVKWPDSQGTWHVLINHSGNVQVINLQNGNVVEKFNSKNKSNLIIPVRLEANSEPFLANANYSKGRMILSIYNPEKKLVYEETLSGGVRLAAIPDDKSGTETLLVSECGKEFCGKIWQYTLKNSKSAF